MVTWAFYFFPVTLGIRVELKHSIYSSGSSRLFTYLSLAVTNESYKYLTRGAGFSSGGGGSCEALNGWYEATPPAALADPLSFLSLPEMLK